MTSRRSTGAASSAPARRSGSRPSACRSWTCRRTWRAAAEHDHSSDGQEEVYATLRGGGEIEIDGERHPIDAGQLVSVMPGTKRKIYPGAEGIRLLIIGGTAGAAYEKLDFTEVGAPDPYSA